jgi:hypothetical protein
MTKHRATSRQWSGIERFVRYGAYDSCIIELRDRVEALEAAQRPTVEDSLTVPADSLAGQQLWASMRFRGVMLLPPPDCADPDFWIAERIYEMGLTDGKNATTGNTAPVTRDRAEDAAIPSHSLMERVADAIYGNAAFGVHGQARAAILAVSDWLDQQELHSAATRLRMEAQ